MLGLGGSGVNREGGGGRAKEGKQTGSREVVKNTSGPPTSHTLTEVNGRRTLQGRLNQVQLRLFVRAAHRRAGRYMQDEAADDLGGEDCLYVGLTGAGRAVAEVGGGSAVCVVRWFCLCGSPIGRGG